MNIGSNATRWSLAGDLVMPAGRVLTEISWLYAWLQVLQASLAAEIRIMPIMLLALPIAVCWCVRLVDALPWRFPWNRLLLLAITAAGTLIWMHTILSSNVSWRPDEWISTIGVADPSRPDGQAILFSYWLLAIYLSIRGLLIGLYAPRIELLVAWFIGGMAAFIGLFAFLAMDPNMMKVNISLQLEIVVISYVVI